MDTVALHNDGLITGMTPQQVHDMNRDFAQYDVVRRVERWSIREFMRENVRFLRGRVLDFGAGSQPYRSLVGGEYLPYSPDSDTTQTLMMLDGRCDAVICNQVTQYVPDVPAMLARFRMLLKLHGYVVMTFATNWDEVEPEDLHRFTAYGMKAMLANANFELIVSERRAEVTHGMFKFPLGHGMVARRRPE